VREQSSGNKPVAGAQVIFDKAIEVSDGAGKFRLVFVGKKPGDIVFLTKLEKNGYELVNKKELEHIILTNSDRLTTDIIVAKLGVLEAAKKRYYAISDKALFANYEQQKQKLEEERQNYKLSLEQYQQKTLAIQLDYDNQKKLIGELSDKLARVNTDDFSKIYETAILYFQNGKIDSAIEKLEAANVLNRAERLLKTTDRTEAVHMEIEEEIKLLKLMANLYLLKFASNKAEHIYDKIYQLDSNNLEIIEECSEFYNTQNRMVKAIPLYSRIIEFKQSSATQKANAYASRSALYSKKGLLDESKQDRIHSIEIYERLWRQDTSSKFYRHQLAIGYKQLAIIEFSLGKAENAILNLNTFNRIELNLHQMEPKNLDYQYELGVYNSRMGNYYKEQKKYDSALLYYIKDLTLSTELLKSDPNNAKLKHGLAVAYFKTGTILLELKNIEAAHNAYKEFNRIEEVINKLEPNNIEFKNGLANSYNELGRVHESKISADRNHIDTSLKYFEDYMLLENEIMQAYPYYLEYKFNLANAYKNLGVFHSIYKNDKETALYHYIHAEALLFELVRTSPKEISYSNSLTEIKKITLRVKRLQQ
jgi:tetratricopeptide (TPR) repeat protein